MFHRERERAILEQQKCISPINIDFNFKPHRIIIIIIKFQPLMVELDKRAPAGMYEESYLEVARALQATNALELSQKFVENLLTQDIFPASPAVWLVYADVLYDRRK